MIFDKIFNKKKAPFEATQQDEIRLAMSLKLPLDMVRLILSKKKKYYSFFGNYVDNYSYDEYQHMLMGASEMYNNQELMGRGLPMNDPRSIKVSNFLNENGIYIQYHPHHGMMIVEKN